MIYPRQTFGYDCRYGYNSGSRRCYSSPYNSWGRWVTLAAVLVAFFLLFFLCSCFSARRRRRRGLRPFYGTGFLGGKTPPGHAPATYYNGPQDQAQPQYGNTYNQGSMNNNEGTVPPYSSAPPSGAYQGNQPTGANQGYYGQQNGVELQAPQNSYQPPHAGENVYAPPPGPPPGK